MSEWFTLLNDTSAEWASCLWRATWQGSLGLVAVWLICRLVPTMPARYQSWLWRLALAKFAIVLVWAAPIELPLLPGAAVPDGVEGPVAVVSLDEHDVANATSAEFIAFAESVGPTASSRPSRLGQPVEGEVPTTRSRIRENSGEDATDRSVTTPATFGGVTTSATRASFLPVLLTALVIAWLAGVVWQGTIFFRGWLGVRRLRRGCRLVRDDDLAESLRALCDEFGLRRRPVLLEQDGGGSAFLLGIFHPAIVVPADLRKLLGPDELRMALAHELAHVKRRDLSWSAVAAMIRVLFFFHPLVWWASRRLELAQEIAADQLASRRFSDDLARYARVLLTVVNQPQTNSILPGLAAGAVGHYQTLRTRIVAMKSFQQTSRRVAIVSAVLLGVVAALGIVPWRLVAAETAETITEKSPEPSDPVKLTPAQEKVLQTLQQPARFEFLDTPLETIVASIKDKHEIDLQLDEKALRDAGIKIDAPVTVHVVDVNLNNALWLLSRQRGLTYVLHGDDLLITTPQEADRIMREGGIDPDQAKLWSGNDKVFRALAEPTTVEFIETPVQDVMDYLADLHSIPIRLDRAALRAAKIGTDSPLTYNIHRVTLNSSLRLMLAEIGLTHVVSHEMLLITTPKERDRLVQHGAFEPDDLRLSPGYKWIFPALAEKTQLDFINMPIHDVADYLQDTHGILIEFDTRAIRKAGLLTNPPVTKKLADVTLHGALNQLLGEFGLAHVVQHEVLLITTPEEARRRLSEGALAPADTKPAMPPFARKPVANALDTAVTVECREQPLSALVETLKEQCDVEIRIDDWGLATVGLTRDYPCTITVKKVPLHAVLKQLLGEVDLGYGTEGELIVITSRDAAIRQGGQAPPSILTDILRMGADVERLGSAGDRRITGVRCGRMPQRFTDESFEILKDLPWLRKLDLGRTKVTDAGLARLSYFPQLRELDLRGTEISDEGLAQLRNVPHLTRLSLSGDRITDAGLQHVAALSHLSSLTLRCPHITDAGFKHLAALETLWSLSLTCPQVTDAGLKHIQGLTRLGELEIRDAPVTDVSFRYLGNMKQLRVVALHDTNVTGAGLEHLERHEHLRELKLAGPKVSAAELTYVAGCRHLDSLSLGGPGVTDAALKHVARLKHLAGGDRLQKLNLTGTQISDDGLVHLAGLTQLKSLRLSQTQVTGVGLSHLRARKLHELALDKTPITDAGLAHLKNLTGLRRLNLNYTQVTDEGLDHLRAWWQNVRAAVATGGGRLDYEFYVGIVYARGTKITPEAARELFKELRNLRVLGAR